MLEGSVRKAGGRVRIAVKLIDGVDGAQIWADRFEDTLEDVFALQDKVALRVAGVIEPAVREADLRRATARSTENMSSYDLYLRAVAIYRTLAKADVLAAMDLLHRAIALDPENGPALGLAAFCHAFFVANGWSDDAAAESLVAQALIPRALQAGGDDAEVLAGLVIAIGILGGEREAALPLADRAMELNPGSSFVWMASGWAMSTFGEPALGFEQLETSLRLNPLSQYRPNVLGMLGFARFGQGRFGEAAALLKQSLQLRPEFLMAYIFLAASLGQLGEREAGREAIARFETLTTIDIRALAGALPDPATRERILEGIAIAEGDGARR